MKLFKEISRFVVFSNLLIASAAVAQCNLTYIILGYAINWNVVVVEGTATLLLYNISLWLSKPSQPELSVFDRTRWFFKHISCFWINSILCGVLLLLAVLQLHFVTVLFLVGIGVMSLSYGLPIWKVDGRYVGLRQVPGLKVFHIALIWSLSSVGLPIVEAWSSGIRVDWLVSNYLGVLKILFLLICTLPFDIRDLKQDSYYHLKTIPILIGKYRAVTLCYIMLAIHSFLLLIAPYAVLLKVGLLFTNLILLIVLRYVIFSKQQKYNTVYWLDVMLIVQCIVVLLFTLL